MKKLLSFLLLAGISLTGSTQHPSGSILLPGNGPAAFPLVSPTETTAIYVSDQDHWLVQKAAAFLQKDIERVTGRRPVLLHQLPAAAKNLVIIGSLDGSPLIRQLSKITTISTLQHKWEAFTTGVSDHPLPGISHALIIAGSDRRGAAYGVFELSRQIGVSPWYWWADVPVTTKKEIYISSQWHNEAPKVKYRGFFINDEAPALSGWTKEKFGGFNHLFYEKVFELLLRMKANYLWPAMWGNAFNDDDTLNPILADKYGIVMGTSHHEPMLRAQQEWKRYGAGPWDYQANARTLDSFWRTGIRQMGSHESIVTIGMRGDGDMPMTEGSNIALLEKIVQRQREIIRDLTGKAPSATPQLWALYKEVQDYYDKGMHVPDDVTLLLCDDNWGNIRKLPRLTDKPRAGGYGLYYHFDYVGGPRNYKWLNTNPIPRIWQQMHLAKEYGVDRIWIVNVGDIKPMELPIEFFLDYAWDPGRWPADSLDNYTRTWASRQFGPAQADVIADILSTYTKYNGRCKPELLSPATYSLLNYREAEMIMEDYNRLAARADSIANILPPACRDAYYQLVLYPVTACANLNELYVTVAKNRLYARQGRSATDSLAARARNLFEKDSALSHYYNTIMAGGKWDHMMDQTHIGYTGWQQPPVNKMPEVLTLPPTGPGPDTSSWGLSIEGSASWWPFDPAQPSLPAFDRYGPATQYIEIFNRRQRPFACTISPGAAWLHISTAPSFTVSSEQRVQVSIDWTKLPPGQQKAPITISGSDGQNLSVIVTANAPSVYTGITPGSFVEANGYLSLESEHYSRTVETAVKWQRVPGLGRTLSGMEARSVTAVILQQGTSSPRLEYDCYLTQIGNQSVSAYFSPPLGFSGKGLQYGISFDDEEPQIITLPELSSGKNWEISVANNIFISSSSHHHLSKPGNHVLKFWMVTPGLVLQKLVVDTGGMKPAYLGPPESYRTVF